jgi:hypothetical protein
VNQAVVSSDVAAAITELNAAFSNRVVHDPDGIGGAYVAVAGLDLGDGWTRAFCDLQFHIPYNYPAAAIYPYYLPGDLAPLRTVPGALQRVEWRGQQLWQVSLRNTAWTPDHDNAVGCVLQVRAWLRRQ